jgi:hypothetical protein
MVIQLVDRWLKHQTLDELGNIVEGIHHLQQRAPRFYDLLDSISNNDMDPSSRSSLLNIIRKVSRHWEATRKLYRTAKKFPLVRNMKIQLASLPQKAFEGQINSSEFSDPCSCLSSLGFVKGQQSVSQLCRNLKLDQKAALVTSNQIRRENDEEVKLMCYGRRDFQVREGKEEEGRETKRVPAIYRTHITCQAQSRLRHRSSGWSQRGVKGVR